MKKSKSIVRTRTTFGKSKNPNEMYYKIDFMTFEKAIRKTNNRFYTTDEKFEIYSYKWYDLRWTYEMPYYWFLLSVLKTETKQPIHPKEKEKQQNPIFSFVVKFWWQILIPLAIVVIGILIERDVINIRFKMLST